MDRRGARGREGNARFTAKCVPGNSRQLELWCVWRCVSSPGLSSLRCSGACSGFVLKAAFPNSSAGGTAVKKGSVGVQALHKTAVQEQSCECLSSCQRQAEQVLLLSRVRSWCLLQGLRTAAHCLPPSLCNIQFLLVFAGRSHYWFHHCGIQSSWTNRNDERENVLVLSCQHPKSRYCFGLVQDPARINFWSNLF